MALDTKKRAGLYMVVRPILFFVVRAVYAPAEGCGNKHFVIKFEAGREIKVVSAIKKLPGLYTASTSRELLDGWGKIWSIL